MKVNEQVCWVVNQILMEHSAGGGISEGPLLTLVKYSSKLWSGLEFLISRLVGGRSTASEHCHIFSLQVGKILVHSMAQIACEGFFLKIHLKKDI